MTIDHNGTDECPCYLVTAAVGEGLGEVVGGSQGPELFRHPTPYIL